jgi:hypothetical protein
LGFTASNIHVPATILHHSRGPLCHMLFLMFVSEKDQDFGSPSASSAIAEQKLDIVSISLLLARLSGERKVER